MPHHRHCSPRPGAAHAGNLLPNPDFAIASPNDPRLPAGWVVSASNPSTLARTSRSPTTGTWALDAMLAFGNEGAGTVQLVVEQPVPVVGGSRLVIGGSFLREPELGLPDASDPGASVWIAGRWLDTTQSTIRGHGQGHTVGQFMKLPTEPLPLGAFATQQDTVVAPRDADALAIVFVLIGGNATNGRTAPLVVDSVFATHTNPVTQPAGVRAHTDHTPGRHRGRTAADPTALWFRTAPA